jgi:DMSO/TMAO reductase YedYZ molybdopterin-dependent catalytic subunit
MTAERSLVAATKPGLTVLATPELNAEAPAHLLDDDITPVERLFVRNTGVMPEFSPQQIAAWTLTIDGCVRTARAWTVAELEAQFEPVTRIAVLECAGNGRAFFPQPTANVPWRHGAVGCVAWTGVRLADLLGRCTLAPAAVYTAHFSPDRTLDGSGPALSRGLPIVKALAPETVVAYSLNGAPIPLLHGGPLRIVAPGYPASASQKWLTRICIRDREHDGERMTGLFYRMPTRPVRPGEPLDPSQFEVLTDMPVRSLITSPRDGFAAPAGQALKIRGHAWSGHTPVATVEVSVDGGGRWQAAELGAAPDTFAWRRFEFAHPNAPAGPIEIIARAMDARGRVQPLGSVPWNPRGYCNNIAHRIRGHLVA